jgi:pyrroline-5-carboxylate reductase
LETIAIIGTGRMGSVIATKLAPYYNLILIDKNPRSCGFLAKELKAQASSSDFFLLRNADYIITALPPEAISNALKEIKPYLIGRHIIINISTSTSISSFNLIKSSCKIVSSKIIGHAQQISIGELPAILIDGDDEDAKQKSAMIFGKIGVVYFGNEELVNIVNKVASEEGIKAAYNIKKRLKDLNVPDEYTSFAIRNVASGTMNSFALGEAGPFAKKLIDKLSRDDI